MLDYGEKGTAFVIREIILKNYSGEEGFFTFDLI